MSPRHSKKRKKGVVLMINLKAEALYLPKVYLTDDTATYLFIEIFVQ